MHVEVNLMKMLIALSTTLATAFAHGAEFEGKCQHVHWTPDAVPVIQTSSYAGTVVLLPEKYVAAEAGDPNNWNLKRATGQDGDTAFTKSVIIEPAKDVIEVMPSTTLTILGESENAYIFRVRNNRHDRYPSCYRITANNVGKKPVAAGIASMIDQAALAKAAEEAKFDALRTMTAGYTWPKEAPIAEVLDDGRRTIIRFKDGAQPATVQTIIDGREAVLSKRYDAVNQQYIIDTAPPKDLPAGAKLFTVRQGDRSWIITRGER
jgi:type IV secretory pathway VirB9-like protein